MHASDNLGGRICTVGPQTQVQCQHAGHVGFGAARVDIELISKFEEELEAPELVSTLTAEMEVVCKALSQDLSEAMAGRTLPERTAPRKRRMG